MKSAISNLKEKNVLDIGCGVGCFSKYCIENGAAFVIGLDISKNMIEQAKKLNNHKDVEYICEPIEDINFASAKFDVIASTLAIHYIEDYDGLVKKIGGWLNVNGEFVFSTEHPIVTARKETNNWVQDREGNKSHWALDHYQEEGKREQHWHIDEVIKYHRTISTLINTLIENGLTIEKIIEPQSIPEGFEKCQGL